jgi:hypothetical protein
MIATTPNNAPAPNLRPRFLFGGLGEFDYFVCTASSSLATVGEAHRSAWDFK